jgi:hypothetical protein
VVKAAWSALKWAYRQKRFEDRGKFDEKRQLVLETAAGSVLFRQGGPSKGI